MSGRSFSSKGKSQDLLGTRKAKRSVWVEVVNQAEGGRSEFRVV
jgi:hypothetical protein